MQLLAKRLLGASIALVCTVGASVAQRQHVNGLTGEPPDTSNWPHPAAPDGNRYPRSSASLADLALRDRIAQLGKAVCWDEQVSIDNTNSCGTCHIPAVGGNDGRLGAVHPNDNFGAFGVIPQAKNPGTGRIDYGFLNPPIPDFDRLVTPVAPPTMIGAYMFDTLFWDQRAGPDFKDELGNTIPDFGDWAALEDLAVGPPLSEIEMGHEDLLWSSNLLQAKLNRSYPLALVDPGTVPPDVQWILAMNTTYGRVFNNVFASHPTVPGFAGVTRERFALALAHYHRTLIPDGAPIDRGTMTRRQTHGFHVIKTKGTCFGCHSATRNPTLVGGVLADPFDNLFSDGQSHSIGLPGQPRRKTPTLRNIGLHVKFFSTGHGSDGISNVFVTDFPSLIKFYLNQGGRFGFHTPLTSFEIDCVTDFLKNALTDPRVAAEQAPFDRPQLHSETAPFEANEYGVGTASALGQPIPEIIANSPPLVPKPGAGNWFKLGVGNAPPGASAVLLVSPAPASGPVLWVASPFQQIAAPAVTPMGLNTLHMPIPMSTSVIGVPSYVQWMFADRYGRSFSNAARIVPFQF